MALALALGSPASGGDRWVEGGRDWWAFRPVGRPAVPEVAGGAGLLRNPIDAFHRAALEESGLAPAPEADRVTLIRRLTIGLTGLPPEPSEIDAFLADTGPDAYERLVDRLLASPRYGEHRARSWLDLARHADSAGYEHDTRRPLAWRYRDWVVDALNDDMPYDRFVRLQLAADELAPAEPRQRAALGFLRAGPTVDNQSSPAIRADELDDMVTATAATFLGLTVGCARCHDHKADPIPTEDYYRLAAVFAPSRPADLSLATAEEEAGQTAASRDAERALGRLKAELRGLERSARDRVDAAKLAALPDALARALESGRVADLTDAERDELARGTEVTAAEVEAALTAEERARRDALRVGIADADAEVARLEPLPLAMGVAEAPGAGIEPTYVLARGRVDRPGAAVGPGPPRAVAGGVVTFADLPPAAPSTGRRAALADWIADPSNPLTARVRANRLWQDHFGTGLVATPSDFGAAGSGPSHPELLDWLAAELIASGWSTRAIERLIVTSAAYRQASQMRNADQTRNAEEDPENVLLWRFPARRLEAEAVRDAILRCAGTLNPAIGGPGVYPPIEPSAVRTGSEPRWPLDAVEGPEVWRRSLYVARLRSVPVPLLEVFDQPDAAQPCPRRERTTTPLQALALLNDPFVLEQAAHFAARVAREAGPDPEARLILAHRIATGRAPEAGRLATLRGFLDRQAARHAAEPGGAEDRAATAPDLAALGDLCHVLLCSNAFLYVD